MGRGKPFELSHSVQGTSFSRTPDFAHPSEAQCARLLDYYGIKWEYEPRTFPIRRNKKGEITESFTPDFFLPDLDLYIELTTLSQKLVTKKNRKIKLLKALYPNIKIKIFYQKDLRNLLFKYNVSNDTENTAVKGADE